MPLESGDTLENARFTLLRHLQEESTGCVVGQASGGRTYELYVMGGEIVAAHSSADATAVLERLENHKVLPGEEVGTLRAAVGEGASISETLIGRVPDELLTSLLFERFRENIYRFLASAERHEFREMDAVFVENIQVGHDSRALVTELEERARDQKQLEDTAGEVEIQRIHGATLEEDDTVALLGNIGESASLDQLLAQSPFEPCRTLELVLRLRQHGAVRLQTRMPAAEDAPTPSPTHGGGDAEDPDMAFFQDNDNSRLGGEFTNSVIKDFVDLTEEEHTLPPRAVPAAPLGDTIIELAEADEATAQRAVSLNFSGPKLQEEDARKKLEVINDVLAALVVALDEASGPGRGQSRIQLLVEGTSTQWNSLFKSVEVSMDGRLPVSTVIRNLQKRPAAEHRTLINRGLSDLVERALSMANEVLDEEGFEAVLEQVAGYQAKIRV